MLDAAQTLEFSVHHDGQSSTQCLTLLHTERIMVTCNVSDTQREREREGGEGERGREVGSTMYL